MKHNRRNFLKTSSAAAAAGLFFPYNTITEKNEILKRQAGKGFSLMVMATNWGFKGSIEAFCAAAKKDGYDGVEVVWPANEAAQTELFAALKKHSLKLAFLLQTSGADAAAQLEHFKKILNASVKNKFQKPEYINCHAGKDFYTEEQSKMFFNYSAQLAKETGAKIYHETHRGRILFAAHVTKQFLDKDPDLKLTLDISHWCNVHESMLGDQKETIAQALDKTEHFHARIGHTEGPQVNDPRAPEWSDVVKQHFDWWDKIAARKRKNGEVLTVLTEFGPPTYMPTLPYTQQPLADQWAINVHMMHLLRSRYQ